MQTQGIKCGLVPPTEGNWYTQLVSINTAAPSRPSNIPRFSFLICKMKVIVKDCYET